MVAAGLVSLALAFGLLCSLAFATARTFIQLLVLGFVLEWVFEAQTALLVFGILCVLSFFA